MSISSGNVKALRRASPILPFIIEPASKWAFRPPPAPRDEVIEGLMPGGKVMLFVGDGGMGKTTVALQIGIHVATGEPIWGRRVKGGPVVGIFCEDDQDELERRGRAVCTGERIDIRSVDQFFPLSREGQDNLLTTFGRHRIGPTLFFRQLDATLAEIKPRLLILDGAADLFGGDFMSTPQVRYFLKRILGSFCVRYGCAVLLLAHPSASGIRAGDGSGFSRAWNNSVRARLFMRRPQSVSKDDPDRRVLELKKANYARADQSISLIYRDGYFAFDGDGSVETRTAAAKKLPSRLARAALDCVREIAGDGSIVPFRELFDRLQLQGHIPRGEYQVLRKSLQRALNELVASARVVRNESPRGYCLPSSDQAEVPNSE